MASTDECKFLYAFMTVYGNIRLGLPADRAWERLKCACPSH
jgi:hypothetical protein